MLARPWVTIAVVGLLGAAGCQAPRSPRALASSEPQLNSATDSGSLVVEAPPPKAVTWVDRHPLFSKPRDYYDSSGSNKVVKVAAATVVGIPAGIVGEIRQVVVGRPPDAQAY
jgi:hypothetical protein